MLLVKKNFMGILIISGLVILLFLCGCNRSDEAIPENMTTKLSLCNKTVIVDAGHGGFDAGASANGLVEKDLNLDVAKKLKAEIEKNGGNVIMTREEDVSTESKNRGERTSKKSSDLMMRKSLMDSENADIYISIHMNKFNESKYFGYQVFYSNGESGQRLGETMQSEMKAYLNDDNNRVAKAAGNSIFILKNAKIPSCIVECGFLSNSDDAEKLGRDEYRQKISEAICKGIIKYFE